MRNPRRTALVAVMVCVLAGLLVSSASPAVGVGAGDVTVDFSSFGTSGAFDPDFYASDGIRFPAEQCGAAGCSEPLVSWVQGDDALLGEPRFGPIAATFTRPVSGLSLRVAPGLQGTAAFVLKAYSASGGVIGTASVTVTQDFGDPQNTGFGYFTIELANLPSPAKAFTLDNTFVRSSFPNNTQIPYGVSSISYEHWGDQP